MLGLLPFQIQGLFRKIEKSKIFYIMASLLKHKIGLMILGLYLPLAGFSESPYQGVVFDSKDISSELAKEWNERGYEVICKLDPINHENNTKAARTLLSKQGSVVYLIEVARVPHIANQQPELMSSLQGHPEWRRYYPSFPKEKKDEVVKTFPWIPILHKQGLELHLKRVNELLSKLPKPKTVWLNNIQGAPSSCGCGNTLCRWTSDYGPKKTTDLIGDKAPGQFLKKLSSLYNGVNFIPVFYTECEEGDKPHFCAGVGCYKGICWKAWSRQLSEISKYSNIVGAAAFFKDLERTNSKYGEPGGWVKIVIEQFQTMPLKNGKKAWPREQIISVIQGWGVSDQEIENQIRASRNSSAKGHVLVKATLDQSWVPKIVKLK